MFLERSSKHNDSNSLKSRTAVEQPSSYFPYTTEYMSQHPDYDTKVQQLERAVLLAQQQAELLSKIVIDKLQEVTIQNISEGVYITEYEEGMFD